MGSLGNFIGTSFRLGRARRAVQLGLHRAGDALAFPQFSLSPQCGQDLWRPAVPDFLGRQLGQWDRGRKVPVIVLFTAPNTDP